MSTGYDHPLTCDEWLCGHCLADGKRVPRAKHNRGFSRERREFVAMLRVKNESRWIQEVVRSTFHLCSRVFVLDDHSEDRTADLARWCGDRVTVLDSPFEGLNESRDKNWLYDQIIRECEPAWILCIDGDEVLEGSAPEGILRAIAERPDIDAWALKVEFVWNQRGQVRTDRIYGDFWRPSLYRPYIEIPGNEDSRRMMTEFRFQSTPFGHLKDGDKPNLHCSSVPQRRIHRFGLAPGRLIHYGYMDRADRVRKLDYYTSIDWKNDAEDWYRHMCQGDRPTPHELPRMMDLVRSGILTMADVRRLLDVGPKDRLLHAGPLALGPIEEGAPWQMSAYANSRQPAVEL